MSKKTIDVETLYEGKVTRTLMEIPTKDIVPKNYNPHTRTSERALKELESNILRVGRILSPGHVDWELGIIDGHRRHACALRLNIETMKMYVYEGDKDLISELYVTLNLSAQGFNPRAQLIATMEGSPIFPKARKPHKILKKHFSPAQQHALVEAGITNPIVTYATKAAEFIHGDAKAYEDERQDTFKRTVWWVIEHKQQRAIYSLFNDSSKKNRAELLRKCIYKDCPLPAPYTKAPRIVKVKTDINRLRVAA